MNIRDALSELRETTAEIVLLEREIETLRQREKELQSFIEESHNHKSEEIRLWTSEALLELMAVLPETGNASRLLVLMRRAGKKQTAWLASALQFNGPRALGPVSREIRSRCESLRLPFPIVVERFGRDKFLSLSEEFTNAWPTTP